MKNTLVLLFLAPAPAPMAQTSKPAVYFLIVVTVTIWFVQCLSDRFFFDEIDIGIILTRHSTVAKKEKEEVLFGQDKAL